MNAAAGQPEAVLQQSGVHVAPNAGYCCAIKPVWEIHQFFECITTKLSVQQQAQQDKPLCLLIVL